MTSFPVIYHAVKNSKQYFRNLHSFSVKMRGHTPMCTDIRMFLLFRPFLSIMTSYPVGAGRNRSGPLKFSKEYYHMINLCKFHSVAEICTAHFINTPTIRIRCEYAMRTCSAVNKGERHAHSLRMHM